jgi:hypothetical protein
VQSLDEAPAKANEYEKFRKPIQEIINFTRTIDERYRENCFEVLLNHYLSSGVAVKTCDGTVAPKRDKIETENLSSETKVFLGQNNITDQMLSKLFIKEKGDIHPVYKITETRRAKAQIQIALLTAFENALKGSNGTFEFSVNMVRERCQNAKMYDGRDFYINFMDSAGLFGSLNYEVIKLSPTGKVELASIVAALSK